MNLFRNITLAILMLTGLMSCKKNKDNSGIPLVQVDITVFTSNPQFVDLNVVGGWSYVSGGSRGILLYRASNEEIIAYERHCTYEPSGDCGQVAVDTGTLLLVDDCCGSEFQIVDGVVIKGPASIPLKRYRTTYDGNRLQVFN